MAHSMPSPFSSTGAYLVSASVSPLDPHCISLVLPSPSIWVRAYPSPLRFEASDRSVEGRLGSKKCMTWGEASNSLVSLKAFCRSPDHAYVVPFLRSCHSGSVFPASISTKPPVGWRARGRTAVHVGCWVGEISSVRQFCRCPERFPCP